MTRAAAARPPLVFPTEWKMSKLHDTNPQRRALLHRTVLFLAAAGASAVVPARADDGMLSKAAVHYQDKPHDGKHCSECAYFIPGKDASAQGSCRLVSGAIDPNGWCERYSA
jgi:hypothetical protein